MINTSYDSLVVNVIHHDHYQPMKQIKIAVSWIVAMVTCSQ